MADVRKGNRTARSSRYTTKPSRVEPTPEPRAFKGEEGVGSDDEPYSPISGPSPIAPPSKLDINSLKPPTATRKNGKTTSNKTDMKEAGVKATGEYMDEFIFKVCVVGNHNVGKTTLVRRICNPVATATKEQEAQVMMTRPTIGVDFSSRIVENIRPGALVRVQLWDTAGLEKFAAVSAPVYRNCAGVIGVVDLLNRDTLDALVGKWLPDVLKQLPDLPLSSVLVVCNKLDLLEKFQGDEAQLPSGVDPAKFTSVGEAATALEKAGITDTLVMDASAKSGHNVEDALALLCNRIIDKIAPATTPEVAPPPPQEKAPLKENPARKRGSPEEVPPCDNELDVEEDEEAVNGATSKSTSGNGSGVSSPVTAAPIRPKRVNMGAAKEDNTASEPLDSSVTRKKRNAKYCPC